MNEENTNVRLEEQLTLFEDKVVESADSEEGLTKNDEFKDAVYAQMRKIHSEGMIVGFQTACHVALDKIYAFDRSAGKKSNNDYKRLIKDLKKFFETSISRKSNAQENEVGEDENVTAETAQN
jgi:hypothetical protein